MTERKPDRSQLMLGVILICVGILFLLNSFRLISWNVWRVMFDFWPLILVFIGLNILLKNTKVWWLVPLLIIVAFSVFIWMGNNYISYHSGIHFFNNFRDENFSGKIQSSRLLDYEDLNRLDVYIEYGAGALKILPVRDEQNAYNVDLSYSGEKPDFNYSYDSESSRGDILIRQGRKSGIKGISEADKWNLFLSKKIPLQIKIESGAGKMDLNLRELMVDSLDIDSGISDLTIYFSSYDTEVEIDSGASNIKIVIPSESGVRIRTNHVISSNNFSEAGLIKLQNNFYQSKNYGEAENRVKLNISASAGNITLIYQ